MSEISYGCARSGRDEWHVAVDATQRRCFIVVFVVARRRPSDAANSSMRWSLAEVRQTRDTLQTSAINGALLPSSLESVTLICDVQFWASRAVHCWTAAADTGTTTRLCVRHITSTHAIDFCRCFGSAKITKICGSQKCTSNKKFIFVFLYSRLPFSFSIKVCTGPLFCFRCQWSDDPEIIWSCVTLPIQEILTEFEIDRAIYYIR